MRWKGRILVSTKKEQRLQLYDQEECWGIGITKKFLGEGVQIHDNELNQLEVKPSREKTLSQQQKNISEADSH